MRHIPGHQGPIYDLAFTADGLLVSAGEEGGVRLWDADVARSSNIAIAGNQKPPAAVGLSCHPTESIIAWGHQNGAHWLNLGTGKRLIHSSKNGFVRSITFLNNGRQLALARGQEDDDSSSGCVEILATDTGKLQRRISTTHAVWTIAAEAGGKRIFWAGSDRRVSTADVSAQDHKSSQPQRREITQIALSHDGKLLAATDDYAIRLYDAATLQEVRQFAGHKGRASQVRFTMDDRWLVSSSWDKTTRFWDVESGREIASHDWEVGPLRTVALAPDGLTGACAGDRGIIAVWDLDG